MNPMTSTFITSIDDFVTSETHTCIWNHWPQSQSEPEEWDLVSVDGMDERVCPEDLWQAAKNEYPDNAKPLEEY